MRILLVRHAAAIESAAAPSSDGERYLTVDGRKRFLRAGKRLARVPHLKVSRIVTSPLVRAVQTGELLAQALAYEELIEVWSLLRPEEPATGPLEALDGLPEDATVALVGHEPQMSELASRILGTPFPLRFSKGSIASLERKKGKVKFQWLLLAKDRRFLGLDGSPVGRVR
jgi:phosphohistidine phosphatase